MTKVAIMGAGGRMGTALIQTLEKFKNLELVAAVEHPGHAAIGLDAGLLAGVMQKGIALTDDMDAAVRASDVVIDFTFHTAVPDVTRAVARYKKAYIIGTTGLTPDELACVESVAQVAPVMMAPNMSFGINLLLNLVKQAAAILNEGYDVEITEAHHRHKKDAPSGTALALAKAVAAGREVDFDTVACYGREGMTGERDGQTIAIHAVRGGDIVGDHTVLFAADGERIEFTHRATSRTCLAMGALKAAAWLVGQRPGFHAMRDLLGL